MIHLVARATLGVLLLAIVAWVIRWRRARPDLCPMWLAASMCALKLSIAATAFAGALTHPQAGIALAMLVLANVAAAAVAVGLWLRRGWLLRPADAVHEARRLTDAALDLTATVEREARRAP